MTALITLTVRGHANQGALTVTGRSGAYPIIGGVTPTVDGVLLTEAGDYLTTDTGDYLAY